MESLAQHVGTQANFLIVIGNVKGLLCGPESVVWCSAHSSSSPDTLLSTSARRPTDDGAVTWQEPFGTKCTLVKQPGASVYERKLLTFRVNIDTDTNKWWEGRIDVAEAVKRGSVCYDVPLDLCLERAPGRAKGNKTRGNRRFLQSDSPPMLSVSVECVFYGEEGEVQQQGPAPALVDAFSGEEGRTDDDTLTAPLLPDKTESNAAEDETMAPTTNTWWTVWRSCCGCVVPDPSETIEASPNES